ncbi:MAG: 50S ribosomal protein L30 [Pseudomonadota bacterium]|jgi:large subunit ribosomal protein L30|uniref:Large ribosomal subunit protein uL30 n=1 Tax=Banduia mediterranea TaxID=3075609 RepID=A0ABU2WJD6_9GAMM|nr:50S ribosomal protein L30 [Algiphilus sp. W345]MCH9826518.1 50S ribosomal protein L30 [Gammaproteobacteria bacterium]MDT0497991.1 50S ribosomal protein L30 [Algiphilus sp. W345]MEC9358840.1 50S ribosomal protein L30 [Pseudomonadota bacterium]
MADKKIRVTLIRSPFGQLKQHRNNVNGLGLRKMHQSRELVATPAVMGMVNASVHMLKVEELS